MSPSMALFSMACLFARGASGAYDKKLCEFAPPTDSKVEQKRREEEKARQNALKDKIESTKLTDERKKELLKMLEEEVSSDNDMVNTLYRVQGKLRCYLDYLNAPQRPKKRPRAASEEPKQPKQAKRSLYDTLKRTLSADAPQEDERLRVPTIPPKISAASLKSALKRF